MAIYDIESEISGTVWEVSIKVGDKISADEPIIVIESMKMEIPVSSESEGVLVELLVAKGDVVVEGQVVAKIESGS